MTDSLLEFPCRFPLKVIGVDHPELTTRVVRIIRAHVPGLDEGSIATRPSSSGKFLSISISFVAESQQQLDAVYRDLTAADYIRFVL